MKFVNHACPGFALAAVPGLPTRIAALSNDGHSEIAVATGMFDCVGLSGSLNPSTVLYPRLTIVAIALEIPDADCSAPVCPQSIGTNSPPPPLLHGSVSRCVQL